jgi:phage terminase large subunit-like protein
MPYRTWADQGYLELCDGNVIDERDIKARILWGAEFFDLREICFDPWNTGGLSAQFVEDGYECVNVRQGYATLSDPSKLFLNLVARGKLAHGRHPVLRWNAACLSTKEHNDNLMFAKPQRTKTSNRIDGISAAVNAMSQAMNAPEEENNSMMDKW